MTVFMYIHPVTEAGGHVVLLTLDKLLMRLICHSTNKALMSFYGFSKKIPSL